MRKRLVQTRQAYADAWLMTRGVSACSWTIEHKKLPQASPAGSFLALSRIGQMKRIVEVSTPSGEPVVFSVEQYVFTTEHD